MTLILAHGTRVAVHQVVDRLVSIDGPPKPFDPDANKNVLFQARDGVAAVAYTGLAYLNDLPTDEWIASTLQGRPFPRGRDGIRPVTFSPGFASDWPDLGQAFSRLESELTAVYARLSRGHRKFPVTIVAVGWQMYRRKPPRPFVLSIEKGGDPSPAFSTRQRRHIGRSGWMSAHPEGHLRTAMLEALCEQLRCCPPDAREAVLIGAMRRVADGSEVVSSDCISVVLPHPACGFATVRYSSPWKRWAEVAGKHSVTRMSVAFCPWVVSRSGWQSPAVLSGGILSTHLGPYTLLIHGPADSIKGDGILAVVSALRRRPLR